MPVGELLKGTDYPTISYAREGNRLMVARCFGVYPRFEPLIAQAGDAQGSLTYADVTGLAAEDLTTIIDKLEGRRLVRLMRVFRLNPTRVLLPVLRTQNLTSSLDTAYVTLGSKKIS